MNRKISTTFFNFRLFLEALKRLRVIGLTTAILAITASALIPTVCWIEQSAHPTPDPYEMETEFLCAPAGFVVLLAPLFFAVLFSFLEKRKESDFFHAIPYTRTCVYVSFVTASLVFVWVIQLACALVAGILWGMIPALVADIGGMVSYTLISMLAAAMLSSFMMLALTVSGTGGSCMLLFLLFAGFVRVVAAIFCGCLGIIDLLPTDDLWSSSFLSPLWFLPLNVFCYMIDTGTASALMYSPPNILYSLAVTSAVFALAGLLYKHRRSEMAGNPAPGVKTQALFRILFTTSAALLIPLLVIRDAAETGLTLVLVVGVLLVYFLYELITTKRPRNMLKAIPGLGIVVGICIGFTILFYAYRGMALYENITRDEVKTVSVEAGGFGSTTYQGRLLGTLQTDDSEVVSLVVRQLASSQKYEREGGWDRSDVLDSYWDRVTVTIRMKGGRTVKRSIMLGEETRAELNDRFMTLEAVSDIAYLLPEDSEIRSGWVDLGNRGDYYYLEDTQALMAILRREFAALTEAEKQEVMSLALNGSIGEEAGSIGEEADMDTAFLLTLRGNLNGNGQYFYSQYVITEALPETRAYLVALWGVGLRDATYYDRGDRSFGGNTDEVLTALAADALDSEFTAAYPSLKGNITLSYPNGDGGQDQAFYLDAEDYPRFAALLLEANRIHANTKPEDVTLSEHTCMLTMYTDMDNKYSHLYFTIHTLVELSPEDLAELLEILQIGE